MSIRPSPGLRRNINSVEGAGQLGLATPFVPRKMNVPSGPGWDPKTGSGTPDALDTTSNRFVLPYDVSAAVFHVDQFLDLALPSPAHRKVRPTC